MKHRKLLTAIVAGVATLGLLCSSALVGLADITYDREIRQEYTFDNWPAGSSFGWEGATLKVAHINATGQLVDEGYTGADRNFVLHANMLGEQAGGMNWGADLYPDAYEISLDMWFHDGVFGTARVYLQNLLGDGKWDSVVFEKGLFNETPDKSICSAYLVNGDGVTVAASYDMEKGGRFPAIRDDDPESGNLGYGRWMSMKIRRDGTLLSVLLNDVVVFTYSCDTLSIPTTTNLNTYILQGENGFYVDNIRLSRLTPITTTTEDPITTTTEDPITTTTEDPTTTTTEDPTTTTTEDPITTKPTGPQLIGYNRMPVEMHTFDGWPSGGSFGWEGATLKTTHIDKNGNLVGADYTGEDLNPVLYANLVGAQQAGGTNWSAQSYPDGDFDVSMDLWFEEGTYGFVQLYLQNLRGDGQWDSVVFEKGLFSAEGNDPAISSAYMLDGNGQVIAASYDTDRGGRFPVIRDGEEESGNLGYGKWMEFTVRKTGSTLSVLLEGKTVLTYTCDTLSAPTTTNINTYINEGTGGFYIDNITLSKLTPQYSEDPGDQTDPTNVPTGEEFPTAAAVLFLLTGAVLCAGAAAAVLRKKARRQI